MLGVIVRVDSWHRDKVYLRIEEPKDYVGSSRMIRGRDQDYAVYVTAPKFSTNHYGFRYCRFCVMSECLKKLSGIALGSKKVNSKLSLGAVLVVRRAGDQHEWGIAFN